MAERVGFEPTVAFRPLRFSRPFRAPRSRRTSEYLLGINDLRGRQSIAQLSRYGHSRAPSGHHRLKVALPRRGLRVIAPVL